MGKTRGGRAQVEVGDYYPLDGMRLKIVDDRLTRRTWDESFKFSKLYDALEEVE